MSNSLRERESPIMPQRDIEIRRVFGEQLLEIDRPHPSMLFRSMAYQQQLFQRHYGGGDFPFVYPKGQLKP